MQREFSTFLDVLRVSAAAVVFLGHAYQLHLGPAWLAGFPSLAHSAVIAFFVLSGFLVSGLAERETTARDFSLNRATRLYGVVLPALALTLALDAARGAFTYQHVQLWKYLPIFLTFSTEWWFLKEDAFSNLPFWSLSYEAWYYVLFAIVVFARGSVRWLLLGGVLLLVGPRLWLLWPVWWFGAAVRKLPRLEPKPARALLVGSLLAVVLMKGSGLESWIDASFDRALGGLPSEHLRYSRFALGDTLFGVLVALMIWSARDGQLSLLTRASRPFRAAASVSFSVYATHYPLLLACAQLLPDHPLLASLLALSGAVLFGGVFERHRMNPSLLLPRRSSVT